MIKTLITPEEISTLARPCYADEDKALAYIVEAEQNNIKPAIGDDLFIQLKEGGQTFLLEGGIYERSGKRYYLNGIKKALAYFVISRLYESSTTELTRQGAVNRRSEYSDNADNSEIISVSRETYAIANRYMEEVEKYLGTDVKNTSQRVRFDLVGGGSNAHRQCRPSSSSSGASPSSPSANIKVVQTLGYSDKDVISQAGVTREFNAVRKEIENIEVPTLPKLAEVAKTGDYNDLKNKPSIPDVSGLASKRDLSNAVNTANEYTDSVASDLRDKINAKAAKKTLVEQNVTSTDLIYIGPEDRYVFNILANASFSLLPVPKGEIPSYEFTLLTGETAYEVRIRSASPITWVKDLEIQPNTRYDIVVDNGIAMFVSTTNE